MLNRLLPALLVVVFVAGSALAQGQITKSPVAFRPANVSFDNYKALVGEVEEHRAKHLVNLDQFIKMSKKKNVLILDARSADRFRARHVAGAINLNFSDFTEPALARLAPDPKTTILIYCNNNFEGDQTNFMTKIGPPVKLSKTGEVLPEVMLALNIPTYINLYGYGYRNIYELSELVDINDPRIKFEGTAVR